MFKSILELCLHPLHSSNDNYNYSFSRKSLLLYFFYRLCGVMLNYLNDSNHGLRTGTCNWQFVQTHLLTPMCLSIGRANSIELYCTETRRPQTRWKLQISGTIWSRWCTQSPFCITFNYLYSICLKIYKDTAHGRVHNTQNAIHAWDRPITVTSKENLYSTF